jgi:tetraacyldisaccharide 4'-kinase
VWARNRLYDSRILKARRLSGPVVSVGNISVGGAGKTPFVILLGGLLKQRGIAFDVLSRGYGRDTRGVLAVDPNGSPRDFGDEPLLIAQHLASTVVVGESRYQAGCLAENKFGPQLHLLDDGFQHRSLARDFDIVLITPEDLEDRLLPGGRLREPLSSLDRTDAVVVSEEMDVSGLADKIQWRTRRAISLPNRPDRPIVFCGIARPAKFVEQLRDTGVVPAATEFYRDHRAYTRADVRYLLKLRDRHRAGGFITTEKDAINLGPQLKEFEPVAVATVTLELLNAGDALDTILRVIAARRGQA